MRAKTDAHASAHGGFWGAGALAIAMFGGFVGLGAEAMAEAHAVNAPLLERSAPQTYASLGMRARPIGWPICTAWPSCTEGSM